MGDRPNMNRTYRDGIASVLRRVEIVPPAFSANVIAAASSELLIDHEGYRHTIANIRHLNSPATSELPRFAENPLEIKCLTGSSISGPGWDKTMDTAINEFQHFHDIQGPVEVRLASILTFAAADSDYSLLRSPSIRPIAIPGDKLLTSRFGRIILIASCDSDPKKLQAADLTLQLQPASSDRSLSEISAPKASSDDGRLSSSNLSLPHSDHMLSISFLSDLTASLLVSSPDVVLFLFDAYDPQLPSFVEQEFQIKGINFRPSQKTYAVDTEAKGPDPDAIINLGALSKSLIEWESAANAYDILVEQTDQVHTFLLSKSQGAEKGGQETKDPSWRRVLRHHDLASSYLPSVHNKIVHVLAHHYSPAVLEAGSRALRGSDRELASLLTALEVTHPLDVYIATLTLTKTPLPASNPFKTDDEASYQYECVITGLRHASHGGLPRAPLQHVTAVHVSLPSIASRQEEESDPGADMNDLTRDFSEVIGCPADLSPTLSRVTTGGDGSSYAMEGGRLQWTRSALVLVPRFLRFDLLAQARTLQSTSEQEISGTLALLHLIQSMISSLLTSGAGGGGGGGEFASLTGIARQKELRQMILAALRSLTLHHSSMGPSWNNRRIGNWIDVLCQGCSALGSYDLSRSLMRGVVCLMVEEVKLGALRPTHDPQPHSLPTSHVEAMSALFSLTSFLVDGWVSLKAEIELWTALICGFVVTSATPLSHPASASRVVSLPFGVGGVIEASAIISGLDLSLTRGILMEGKGKILSQPSLLAQHLSTLPTERVATAVAAVEGAGNLYVSFARQFNQLCKRAEESLSGQSKPLAMSNVDVQAQAQILKDNATSFKPRPRQLLLLLQTLTTMYHYDLLFSSLNAMMLSDHVCNVEDELSPLLFAFDRWLGPPPSTVNPDPSFFNPVLQPTITHLQRVQSLLSKSASHIGRFLLNKLRRHTVSEITRIRSDVERNNRSDVERNNREQMQLEAQKRAIVMQQVEADAQLLAYQQQQQRQRSERERNVARYRMRIEQEQEQMQFDQGGFIHEQSFDPEQPPSPPPPPLPSPPSPHPPPGSDPTPGQSSLKYLGVSAQGQLFTAKTRVRGTEVVVYKGSNALEAAKAYDSATVYLRGGNAKRNFNTTLPDEPEESVRAKLDAAVALSEQTAAAELVSGRVGSAANAKEKKRSGSRLQEGQGEAKKQQQQYNQPASIQVQGTAPQMLANLSESLLEEAIARYASEWTTREMRPTIKALLTLLSISSIQPSEKKEMVEQARGLIRKDLLSPELLSLASML